MNERILIIDDEETLCYFLKESLEEKGYQAVAVHTAKDGLQVVTKQDIDLVLLDLKLPDGDGLSVLHEMRKAESDLPVIVLTGHAAVESAVQAMKLGAYDYLEKPVNLAELTSSLADALESQPRRAAREAGAAPGRGAAPEAMEGAPADAEAALRWAERAELSRMYRRLERQIKDVQTLDSISFEMMQSWELDELIERTVDRLVQLSSVDMVAVFVGDAGGQELVLANQRRFPSHIWEDTTLRRVSAEGILRQLESRVDGALPLNEAVPDPWIEEVKARLGNDTLVLLVALRDGNRLWGLMLVGHRGSRLFEARQVPMLCSIGERLGLVMGHASQLASFRERVRELSEARLLHENILQDMTNGLVVVDREGKIRLVNRAGERLLGCKEDEVVGSGVEGVLGFGAEIVRSSLERALAYSGEEIVVSREGGESIPLGMSVSPLRGDGDKVNGVVVMLSDLREAKAMEEERRRLDRLAFLGEISAVMAHEIRNPLAGMAAGIQHMLTKFEEGDEKHEAMERILKEGERVNRIIEDILLISRPPHLKLAPCEISEVMEEVIGDWEERARGQGVEISKYYASGVPLVKGDKMRLHQAFSNLVSNGIEAMAEGGRLSVAVTGPTEGVDGRYVEVEIRDTGVGIQEEELDNIFEPFYRTRARGTGLGLAIARRIISEHGGEAEVESEEAGGTRFVVRFPLARSGAS